MGCPNQCTAYCNGDGQVSSLLRRENAKADINGVKENVEYIFSIDVLLLLALVAPRIEYFRGLLVVRGGIGTQMYSQWRPFQASIFCRNEQKLVLVY